MKQFILPGPPDHTGTIRLSGKDYHYLARVRRLKAGTVFPARLPSGETARVAVQSVERDCLIGVCQVSQEDVSQTDVSQDALPPVFLLQGLPKPPKMDLIVRQAAEAGIAEIIPFISEYSQVRFGEEKTERWNRIVKEARQQSGSRIATAVGPVCTLDGLFARWEVLKNRYARTAGIILHQEPVEKGGFHGCLADEPALVALAVGPEGGFSPAELARFLAAGFKPLVLGAAVLRTETAALAAAAAVRIILLESASWTLKIP
ncbi:MAG: 16S rRNA (uracil(1498)-N(3))-methyltransferase [Spirochaetaceae bacterium]|jgi:16S rRNA (uracil1498-N3)-methyltransferase|nr:16S rRNA (uracil(1498)-N(3))-methyltransferase [Spirochaetaceae bacterium]